MPSLAQVKLDWQAVLQLDTLSMAREILAALLPSYDKEEMDKLVYAAYAGKFETPDLTPTVPVGRTRCWSCSVAPPAPSPQDVALSMLPRLMTAAREKCGVEDEILILTATSGDTGKAAMAGFQDVPGTKIIVFYPYGGVSAVQQQQMESQLGRNVCVCAVRGNFDDTQTGVKEIFAAVERQKLLERKGVRCPPPTPSTLGGWLRRWCITSAPTPTCAAWAASKWATRWISPCRPAISAIFWQAILPVSWSCRWDGSSAPTPT